MLTFNMFCFSNSFTEKDCTKHVEHIGTHHKCQLLEFNIGPINIKSAVHMATRSLNLGLFRHKSGGREGRLKFFLLWPLFSHELKNQNFSSWGTLNLPLRGFWGEVDTGRGNPRKKSIFFGHDRNFLSTPPNFEKIIVLVFLKATYPQIPY